MFGYYTQVNDADVRRKLFNLAVLLSPAGMGSFLGTEIGPYLSRRAGERFASEGDDATGPWAPLKPYTVQVREQGNWPVAGEHPINRRTGELENWVVGSGWDAYPTAAGASMRYPGTRPKGELRKKVTTAQQGKSHPSTVARPVLAVNETDLLFTLAALTASVKAAGS